MDLITPEIGLLFWQTIVFLVLILILAKFAWRPILGAVKEREDSINNALSSAEEARKEMQNLKADNEQLRKEARAERDAILKEARELKEKVLASATEEAQTKADMIVAQAKESIEMEKKAAMAEIKSQVANLSIEIAEKVIRKELSSKEKQHQMINEMLGDVTLN
ncbi:MULTISPECIES: F0F1 ATP synthase subunit B [Zunongwangia]|jgi:F-type H+-transporting ATPase subunit b|uniref:ATP synthase subunit b n=2 Tax=Zunongwangia profunda TaxID=398743 RepID=D5BBJ2_ZUNPS|nr:F0F1 ATP synthase subunit B [Zunongwangia profunda]MAG87975.1 ATP synthase F0 subunit B [Flavobacteriaceae bacterium]ADF50426.1 ATP synthase subunit B [Zunongwangia profunda SM-A87]MCC4230312.1 F0F1 ATP synthase subunit B [Zunongwangia profunda]HAJ82471.1 F0F1 ATP synthase subunit B [Zunongwangia profunda]HCV81476.1 F0F1 ATP synthase subunit B [Zunongwangia profunda]|tara:strand:- start:10512 stop:11006 length:495 start_codon:yes stop_codon:yes gene_type:complete